MPSFSVVGSNTGNDTSIEISTLSIAAGDLCLLWNCADGGGSNPADVTPTDFNQLRTLNISNRRAKIFYKILTGSETTVTGLNGNNSEQWIVLVLRPDATITSVTDNDTNNQATTGDPTSQTITASGESAPVVLYGHMYASGAVSPRSTSPAMSELTSGTNHYSHYYIYNDGDTPADHTYDMDDEGTNFISSGYLTFTFLTNTTLDVGVGSFTLTGQAVSLEVGRRLSAGAGSFSLSGQAVSLEHGRNLAVGAGSFALAGQDVTLTYTPVDNPVLDVGAGSFTLTGQDVALRRGYPMSVGAGAFSLAGQDVSLLRDLRLSVGAGSFALSGQDVSLLRSILFAVGAGAFTLGGQDVALLRGRRLSVGAGAYALTGQDISLLVGRALQVGAGSFVLSGQDVSLRQTYNPLQVGAGAFALSGQPVSLEVGKRILAEAGAFTLTGQDIAFVRDLVLAVGSGSFVLSGQDVALLRAYALAVEAGVFILTGGDVLFSVVRRGFNASPGGALIVGVSGGGASRLGVAPGGAALLGIAQGGMILLSARSGGSGRIRAK